MTSFLIVWFFLCPQFETTNETYLQYFNETITEYAPYQDWGKARRLFECPNNGLAIYGKIERVTETRKTYTIDCCDKDDLCSCFKENVSKEVVYQR